MRFERLKMQMNCLRVTARKRPAETPPRTARKNIRNRGLNQRPHPLRSRLRVQTRKLRRLHRRRNRRHQQRRSKYPRRVVQSLRLRLHRKRKAAQPTTSADNSRRTTASRASIPNITPSSGTIERVGKLITGCTAAIRAPARRAGSRTAAGSAPLECTTICPRNSRAAQQSSSQLEPQPHPERRSRSPAHPTALAASPAQSTPAVPAQHSPAQPPAIRPSSPPQSPQR